VLSKSSCRNRKSRLLLDLFRGTSGVGKIYDVTTRERKRSAKRKQTAPEIAGSPGMQKILHLRVSTLPKRHRARKQFSSFCRQRHQTATPIRRIHRDANQAALLQTLDASRQGGLIHGEQCRYGRHTGWLRTVERHHQRELSIRQAERTECVVEAASESSCRPLHMKTETGVAYQQRCLIRWVRFRCHSQIILISMYSSTEIRKK